MKWQKLCLFLPIFIFLLLPKDTFAKSYEISTNWITLYSNGSVVSQGLGETWALRGENYDTINYTGIVDKVTYAYRNKMTSLDLSKHYDYSFKIFQPNISVASTNSFNGGKPIVTLNNNTCYVDYASSSTSSSASFTQIFTVKCTNVELTEDFVQINIFSSPTDYNAGLMGSRYGVNRYFDITTTGDNSSVTSAIEKNTEAQKETTQATKEQTETIKDKDTSESQEQANGFFGDFESDDYGLSDIITMPLTFIQGLSNGTCNSLNLPLPFVNQNVTLPCMTSIYQTYFGSFLTLYQLITTGFIAYWVCINIFRLVQGFKNPDNDEIEVMEL